MRDDCALRNYGAGASRCGVSNVDNAAAAALSAKITEKVKILPNP
jgi:hypothetical protein